MNYSCIFLAIVLSSTAHSLAKRSANFADISGSDYLDNNVIHFTVNVDDIEKSAENSVELPETLLGSVPFTIQISKKKEEKKGDEDQKYSLQVALTSVSAKMSFTAKGDIKLLHKEENSDPKKIEISNDFNSAQPTILKKILDDWNDLGNYKKDNQIRFEITVTISSLQRRKSPITTTTSKFLVKVRNVNKSLFSQEVSIADVKWKVLTEKNEDHLSIFLYAIDEDMDQKASWEVKVIFKLLTFDSGAKPFSREVTHTYNWKSLNYGFFNFISWDVLTKAENKHLDGDAAVFQIDVTVTPKTSA